MPRETTKSLNRDESMLSVINSSVIRSRESYQPGECVRELAHVIDRGNRPLDIPRIEKQRIEQSMIQCGAFLGFVNFEAAVPRETLATPNRYSPYMRMFPYFSWLYFVYLNDSIRFCSASIPLIMPDTKYRLRHSGLEFCK